jgi:dihydropteroate synthase
MIVNTNSKNYFNKKSNIRYNGRLIDLTKPLVMGILNITPDSFYDGGRYHAVNDALAHAGVLLNQGADIIDIGACSTRPGSKLLSASEELKRLIPVLGQIRQQFPDAVLSVDTFRAEVVSEVITAFGDIIINDISGGMLDNKMFETIARYKVPYVLMHIKGTPQNMQHNPSYVNVTKEVINHLSQRVYRLHELGVSDVIIDPGFGFGKNLEHNYQLFNHLDAFRFFELPLMVGVSRKSMIYKMFDFGPEDSLTGTTVLNTLALQAGASILRVHDVKPAVEAIAIYEKLKHYAQ